MTKAIGISRREFARREDCDESLVRKRIRSGHLAVLADGTIDPALVGTPWRRGNEPDRATTVSGGVPARWESEAYRLYYEAQLAGLKWNRAVDQVVLVDDVAQAVRLRFDSVRTRASTIGGKVAKALAKIGEPAQAKAALDNAVWAALAAMSADGDVAV